MYNKPQCILNGRYYACRVLQNAAAEPVPVDKGIGCWLSDMVCWHDKKLLCYVDAPFIGAQRSLGGCLLRCVESETFADVIFIVGPSQKRFPAHKVIGSVSASCLL